MPVSSWWRKGGRTYDTFHKMFYNRRKGAKALAAS
jgi:hypothetical protein